MDGTQTITIEVDKEVADFYNSATTENRQKLSAILNLKLREAVRSKRSAIDIMNEISQQAESNGLTPEILASEGILERKNGILVIGGQLEAGFTDISEIREERIQRLMGL